MSAAASLPALLAVLLVLGCDADRAASTPTRPAASIRPVAAPLGKAAEVDRSYAYPAAARIVAIGDLHGDLAATRTVLRLAGAINDADRWTGGSLVVVQTGDELDRGDGEQGIVDLFDRLTEEARAAGGAVHALNGNHEIMNVQSDFRYVTEGGFKDFEDVPGLDLSSPQLSRFPPAARARAAALLPGGPYAKKLAAREVIIAVGDTVFVHGGVLPSHVGYGIAKMNGEVRAWMDGKVSSPPSVVTAEDGPVWTRLYSDDAGAEGTKACETLDRALAAMSARRMVVGHTVQKGGVNSACSDKVWRIDVGMSAHYGGQPAALEITADAVRVLTSKK